MLSENEALRRVEPVSSLERKRSKSFESFHEGEVRLFAEAAKDGQTRIGWSNQHDTPAKGAVGARIRIMKVAGMGHQLKIEIWSHLLDSKMASRSGLLCVRIRRL